MDTPTETTTVDTFGATEEPRTGEAKTFEYDLPQEKNGRTYRTTSSLIDWE